MHSKTSLFKVLNEPIRLRPAILLAAKGKICACLLAEDLEEPDFKILRRLGIMHSAGVVEVRRKRT